MKVEIDDRELKRLYNLESWCTPIFGAKNPEYSVTVGSLAVKGIQKILKPISNRPTLDELFDIYEKACEERHHTATDWKQAKKAGLKAVVESVYGAMWNDHDKGEGDMFRIALRYDKEYQDD